MGRDAENVSEVDYRPGRSEVSVSGRQARVLRVSRVSEDSARRAGAVNGRNKRYCNRTEKSVSV